MQAKRIVVVGASAAGLRCAARLARLQPSWQVTVVESQTEFSVAACGLPYVLSGDIGDGKELRQTPYGSIRDTEFFSQVKGITVLEQHRATRIDVEKRQLFVDGADGEKTLEWDELVLATGARARRLPDQPVHPRVMAFHQMSDMTTLLQQLQQGKLKHVAIVGAGLVGCEISEAFAALWGVDVTLLEAADRPLAAIVDNVIGSAAAAALQSNGITLKLGHEIESIQANTDSVTLCSAGNPDVTADIAVVALGVDPNTELAQAAGISIGSCGGITTDGQFATSLPHIWAVGDCIEVKHAVTGQDHHLPLGSLANRQGRVLANVLAGTPARFAPVVGTTVVKIFEETVAAVGITLQQALTLGLEARAVWTSAQDRADYWPEATDMFLQLVYDKANQKLLGVQAFGCGEVCKRIDVAAQILARGGTLEDCAQVEHAYAPPYAPAMDPLPVAAMVAQNQEQGLVATTPTLPFSQQKILDVRLTTEQQARPLANLNQAELTSMPLDQVRDRIGEFSPDQEWLVVCEKGTRSAEAARLLNHNGIKATYLGGGLSLRQRLAAIK